LTIRLDREYVALRRFGLKNRHFSDAHFTAMLQIDTPKVKAKTFVKASSSCVDSVMICKNCGALLKDETELAAHQKVCPGLVPGRW
jgi:hypothetical protein